MPNSTKVREVGPFKRPEGKPRRCRICGEKVHPQVRDFCRACFERVFPFKKEETVV